jgi:hypothetical protein
MVLYTPLGASCLNMNESIQRILARRALEGHHPQSPEEIIKWLERRSPHGMERPGGRYGLDDELGEVGLASDDVSSGAR